jgi:phosphoglycolate phosphatase
MNSVLRKSGLPAHPVDSFREMVGDGVHMLVKRALPSGMQGDEVIGEFVLKMREAYSARWDVNTRPYAGVVEMLDGLADRGIKMSIFSNKPDEFTQLTVSRFLDINNFSVVIGLKSGIPKKPDPAGAVQISKKLSIPPEEFIYVGDTGTDMKTAVAANMQPVGVLWGFRDEKELLENGARYIIKKPSELFRITDNE